MKKLILPLVAVVLAVAGSAFTTVQKKAAMTGDLVWFLVDANGNAVNPSGGVQSDTPPSQCDDGSRLCAVSLNISDNEVVQNGSLYSIAPMVDETDPAVYERHATKN
ncbi:DUF6520 family protein [Flaviaesturariibacter amylovorans]|uniref:Uncharacterized protein n=1 Tax=Flaviaesturariibacter amylovorans TaxID=1084520 RepID=A0ABP8HIF4_9BACT